MMTREFTVALGFAALAFLATTTPVTAQGWIDPLPGRSDPGVVRVHSDVDVRITGRVAEVVVEEWFENRGAGLGEGVYVYPLPGEAVFSNFSLYQGDEELRGEAMDADRARSIYTEIVRRQRDPALIELVGHGLIRARVFPIPAGESRKITLRYTQVLERAGDALQFRYAGARGLGALHTRGPRVGPGGQVPGRRGDIGRDHWPPTELTLRAEADPFVGRRAGRRGVAGPRPRRGPGRPERVPAPCGRWCGADAGHAPPGGRGRLLHADTLAGDR